LEEKTMERTVKKAVRGFNTTDGAGVHLVRVLGNSTVADFDPILMLDSFDSFNPDDYTAGFPMHPHRGIETISYVVSGTMRHRDSLGSTDDITDGEVQWMTAGSGILHEELIPPAPRLLGVQLWLNLPAKDKMAPPAYHSVRREDIPEKAFPGGALRVLAGNYRETAGYQSEHLPLDYYDIRLEKERRVPPRDPAGEGRDALHPAGGGGDRGKDGPGKDRRAPDGGGFRDPPERGVPSLRAVHEQQGAERAGVLGRAHSDEHPGGAGQSVPGTQGGQLFEGRSKLSVRICGSAAERKKSWEFVNH
jgi:redox-sensitive bicupin YhaK (pirin superfamily)